MTESQNKKPRRKSWEINDLAWTIPTDFDRDGKPSKCKLPAKLMLTFLGKCSNNQGESWHGYASITKKTGLSRDSVNKALKFLRSLGILEWKQGGGHISNRYRLDLEKMRELAQVSASAAGASSQIGHLKESELAGAPTEATDYPSVRAEEQSASADTLPAIADRNSNRTPKELLKELLKEEERVSVFSGDNCLTDTPTQDTTDAKASPVVPPEACCLSEGVLENDSEWPEAISGELVFRTQGMTFNGFDSWRRALDDRKFKFTPGEHSLKVIRRDGNRAENLVTFELGPEGWDVKGNWGLL